MEILAIVGHLTQRHYLGFGISLDEDTFSEQIGNVFLRKHTLNCHRMRPALFQVLCEIKEKTGSRKIELLCAAEVNFYVYWLAYCGYLIYFY